MLSSKLARNCQLEKFHASWRAVLSSLRTSTGRSLTNNCTGEQTTGALFCRRVSLYCPSFDKQKSGLLSRTDEQAPISGGAKKLLVSASGPDQPGIVSRLSKRVLECGGNVEESQMCRLAGDFTVLMLVSINGMLPKKAEDLRSKLLEIEGLQVQARWATDVKHRKEHGHSYHQISLRGSDTPGLVYNLAEYLASHGVNIESLRTCASTRDTPVGATIGTAKGLPTPLAPATFSLEAVVTIPGAVSPGRLLAELECLQRSMGADITLAEIKDLESVGGKDLESAGGKDLESAGGNDLESAVHKDLESAGGSS